MLVSIVKKYNYVMQNHAEKVGLGGFVLILLAGAIYLEVPGNSWKLTLPLIFAGLSLFALNWHWSR